MKLFRKGKKDAQAAPLLGKQIAIGPYLVKCEAHIGEGGRGQGQGALLRSPAPLQLQPYIGCLPDCSSSALASVSQVALHLSIRSLT